MQNITTQNGELSQGLKQLLFTSNMKLVWANNVYSKVKLYVQYIILKHTHAYACTHTYHFFMNKFSKPLLKTDHS